ncbi:cytochrome P450 94A2-like [Silene latifolia]|uniref:cytochrome P450 94A2-like n=1 Tax=Silene latifolia TaxID=37657 RepID=UPI003D78133F
MTYLHAALSETMRLYPPVPADLKYAAENDVLPDGTKVKKGSIVGYFAQSMGWSEKLWGKDWSEYRPERWLAVELTADKKRRFVPRDAYSYPVFMAGPRICLGKEMAYLQMKSVVAAVLSRFTIVPEVADGFEPVYFIETVAIMHGGFPVRVHEKVDHGK